MNDGSPDLEALRARLRARRDERARQLAPTHRHGTFVVCPCGVILGITCVAFEEGYVAPTGPCAVCGLFDEESRRRHQTGCSYAKR